MELLVFLVGVLDTFQNTNTQIIIEVSGVCSLDVVILVKHSTTRDQILLFNVDKVLCFTDNLSPSTEERVICDLTQTSTALRKT